VYRAHRSGPVASLSVPEPGKLGRMKIDRRDGKEAETRFQLLQAGSECAFRQAVPSTGRTRGDRGCVGIPYAIDPWILASP